VEETFLTPSVQWINESTNHSKGWTKKRMVYCESTACGR